MKDEYYKINKFVERMAKIGISVNLSANFPWIYISKINNKIVKERFYGEHGFTAFLTPVRMGSVIRVTDIRQIFKIIRKYCNET